MADLDLVDLAARATAAAQSWAPGCRVDDLQTLEGGAVSLVFTATATGSPRGSDRIVLKVAPPGLPPVRNRDVLRQGRCMDALAAHTSIPVPTVLFSDAGAPVEVPPFFATTFVAGECAEPLLDAPRVQRSPELVQARILNAARVLGELHRVRPADIGLGDEPVSTPTEEVERWTRTLESCPDDLRVGYQEAADALLATAPAVREDVVVHGDYRVGNMLIDGETITGIIDWELWARADRGLDLTWLLFFTEEADHPIARHGVPSGTPSFRAILDVYEDAYGAPAGDLTWWHALTRYKEAAAMALIAKLARRRDPDANPTWGDTLAELLADARTRVT